MTLSTALFLAFKIPGIQISRLWAYLLLVRIKYVYTSTLKYLVVETYFNKINPDSISQRQLD